MLFKIKQNNGYRIKYEEQKYDYKRERAMRDSTQNPMQKKRRIGKRCWGSAAISKYKRKWRSSKFRKWRHCRRRRVRGTIFSGRTRSQYSAPPDQVTGLTLRLANDRPFWFRRPSPSLAVWTAAGAMTARALAARSRTTEMDGPIHWLIQVHKVTDNARGRSYVNYYVTHFRVRAVVEGGGGQDKTLQISARYIVVGGRVQVSVT